jgi:hypothetical protein
MEDYRKRAEDNRLGKEDDDSEDEKNASERLDVRAGPATNLEEASQPFGFLELSAQIRQVIFRFVLADEKRCPSRTKQYQTPRQGPRPGSKSYGCGPYQPRILRQPVFQADDVQSALLLRLFEKHLAPRETDVLHCKDSTPPQIFDAVEYYVDVHGMSMYQCSYELDHKKCRWQSFAVDSESERSYDPSTSDEEQE